MIKDYIPIQENFGTEIEFVESFWTKAWEREGLQSEGYFDVARKGLNHSEELEILLDSLKGIPKGGRVLDGGCGTGLWTLYLNSLGYDTYGIDISAQSIAVLKERFPNQHFMAEDIRKLGFSDSFFDAYFSWGTFEHFEIGLSPCFQEAYRVLRPGGLLLISVPLANTRHLTNSRGLKDPNTVRRSRFYQWRLTPGELQVEFERHGFDFLEHYPTAKAHGVGRYLHHEWGIQEDSFLGKIARKALTPLISSSRIAHMVVGVGRKRAE